MKKSGSIISVLINQSIQNQHGGSRIFNRSGKVKMHHKIPRTAKRKIMQISQIIVIRPEYFLCLSFPESDQGIQMQAGTRAAFQAKKLTWPFQQLKAPFKPQIQPIL